MSQPDGFLQHHSVRSLAQRSEVLLIVVDEQHVLHEDASWMTRADGVLTMAYSTSTVETMILITLPSAP
jgi:hypothetical protein